MGFGATAFMTLLGLVGVFLAPQAWIMFGPVVLLSVGMVGPLIICPISPVRRIRKDGIETEGEGLTPWSQVSRLFIFSDRLRGYWHITLANAENHSLLTLTESPVIVEAILERSPSLEVAYVEPGPDPKLYVIVMRTLLVCSSAAFLGAVYPASRLLSGDPSPEFGPLLTDLVLSASAAANAAFLLFCLKSWRLLERWRFPQLVQKPLPALTLQQLSMWSHVLDVNIPRTFQLDPDEERRMLARRARLSVLIVVIFFLHIFGSLVTNSLARPELWTIERIIIGLGISIAVAIIVAIGHAAQRRQAMARLAWAERGVFLRVQGPVIEIVDGETVHRDDSGDLTGLMSRAFGARESTGPAWARWKLVRPTLPPSS